MASKITKGLCTVFVVFIFYNIYEMYQLYNPLPCQKNERCISPSWKKNSHFQLIVCSSMRERIRNVKDLNLLWKTEEINIFAPENIDLTVSLPRETQNNGSLYMHVFLTHTNGSFRPLSDVFYDSKTTVYETASLTKYLVLEPETVHLLSGEERMNLTKENRKPVTHWKSQMSIYIMSELLSISIKDITKEVAPFVKLSSNKAYLPMVHVNDISFTADSLLAVNLSSISMPLRLLCTPISFGKFRMLLILQNSLKTLKNLGFQERDTDEMKNLMFNTNIHLLLCTIFVASIHLLLDILAFQSDISFWMKKKSMKGLSMNTLAWRCGSHLIIFLYLLDQGTSHLVLVPAGVATLVEMWKIKKATKLKISWTHWKPKIEFGTATEEEKTTGIYDSQIMKYLSYLLYPLSISGAIYSLLYIQHKSWYSWCIQSLSNGIYAFGFIFMLPQLFVNYKLKSVAHLSFTAFVYKAINTFIDDLFAFIITMPTAHRVACFRDDVVFIIYLYQRWLYKVDKSRTSDEKGKED